MTTDLGQTKKAR